MRHWTGAPHEGFASVHVIMEMEESEDVMDKVQERLGLEGDYRVVVHSVEATLPRLSEPEENKAPKENGGNGRASREELYADVMDMATLNRNYLLLVGLSALVAAVGLWRDNTAVTIGAMVIAPLLGPNVGFSLASTLADFRLGLASLRTLGAGVAVAVAVSVLFGLVVDVDPSGAEIAARAHISPDDLLLALAAGMAGILSMTYGVPVALVGVMVALALMPPLVAAGMLLGNWQLLPAANAGLLFLANIICLNLAGVAVFLLKGVRPRRRSEQDRARIVVVRALVVWATMLAILLAVLITRKVF